MKVYMMWHGGANYALPTVDDAEEFSSLQAAKESFWSRADRDPFYPCVENPEAWILFSDPRENASGDVYPDRVMTLGPRGGVRIERC